MAESIKFLYLSEEDVISTGVSFTKCIDLCTQSLAQHGRKQVENPPKPGIHPQPDAFIHAMPAWLKESGICGIKWVSGFPSNVPKKMPTVAGLIVLNDTTTGYPLAIMDGTYITGLRTAAISAISAKHLARKDSKVLAVVGTGLQGKYNSMVLTHILPSISTIQIYDVWQPSIDGYVKQMNDFYKGLIKIEVKSSIKDAVSGADVVVAATGKLSETSYYAEWIKPGALVLPIHTGGFERDIIKKMDVVVVDDWVQFSTFAKSDYSLPQSPDAEIGEIIAGDKPGREKDEHKIINFNVGLAIDDVIVAQEVLNIARKKGLGQEIVLKDLTKAVPLPEI